jgi:hypothetical protein
MADTNDTDDAPDDKPSLFLQLQGWVREDRRVLGPWYREARTDYAFKAGGEDQWDELVLSKLKDSKRPYTTFNFIGPSVNSVAGMEVSNRQEVTYLPRTTQQGQQPGPAAGMAPQQNGGLPGQPGAGAPVPGADDTGPAEIFTAAGQYFRDQCDAEDEESDAFQDCATCGVGFTESRVDFDEAAEGKMLIDRCDSLEMGWDHRSTKRNMVDSRRFHRVRQMDKRAALEMFDGHTIEEIDAAWARPQNIETAEHMADRELAYNQGNQNSEERNTVHVVEITWVGSTTKYTVANPKTGEVMKDLDAKQLKVMKKRAQATGIKLAVQSVKAKEYRQAFLGSESILDEEQDGTLCQSQKGFKFNAITGTRDRNKRQWVGIVRAMRDPQRWTNALYSSVLNTIMTSGKGVMAERDAFENPQKAEEQWSDASQITMLKTGALSGQNPKIVQKTPHTLPPGILEMMQFAMQSLRDVSGVNVETLGSAETDQAAALDRQRKQAAALSLAPFFDGLRRYRKEQGRIMLDLIQKFLSDGRLIRIVGPDYEKYIPLMQSDDVTEFDIIVAESPSSPNQKEASWEIIQSVLPVVGKNMGPNATVALLRASPMPTTAVDEFKDAAAKDAEAAAKQPNPDMEKIKADVEMKKMDAVNGQRKAEQDFAVTQQKAAVDTQLKQMDLQLKQMELQLAQFQAHAQVEQTNIQAQNDREKMVMERDNKQQEFALKRESEGAKMNHDMTMRQMEVDAESEKEGMKTFSKDLPSLVQTIAQQQSQSAEANKALAEAIKMLAQAQMAPRVTEMADPVTGQTMRAVSTVQANGMVN